MAGPRLPVAAPRPQPSRIGLLAVARDVTPDDRHWMSGLQYQPENCTSGGAIDPDGFCADGTPASKTITAGPDIETYNPFGVWAGEICAAFDVNDRDYVTRATNALLKCQSRHAEREFWRGDIARANDWPNFYLTSLEDSDTLSDTVVSPTQGLACLEEYLASCACGARGMIHANRATVAWWAANNLLFREGTLLVTANDNIVVSGAGYDGSGPSPEADSEPIAAATGSTWAYATGMVEARLGPIEVIPKQLAHAVNKDDNTIEYRAERMVALTTDACCLGAVQMDIDPCDIGGAGS